MSININSKNNTDYSNAIEMRSVTKRYRISHEKNPSLKHTILKGRRTTYQEFLALDNVSFDICKGQTFGIIGSNGSGKSTVLKLIANILKPTSGEVVVNGSLSALLELGAGFHPDLTGKENIYINAAILGMRKRDVDKRLDDIIEFSELEKFIDTPVKHYSSGMYMRLGFSVAINVNPDILLVDEVLAVGDLAFQAKCYKVIYDFMKMGKTIIIVSHDLDSIADLCSRVMFLKDGKIQNIGKPLDIVAKYRACIEEMEKKKIIEQQKSKRKKIFKTVIDNNRKIVSGEEIDNLKNMVVDGEVINRFGSGDARIESVRLLNADNQEIDICNFGDKVKIEYRMSFKKRIENPIFGLRITDQRGNIIYGMNTKVRNIKTGIFKKGDNVKVTFSFGINLIDGRYSITSAIGYSDMRTYCDWVNDILELNVINKNNVEGIIDLNPGLSIEKIDK
jgi:ABC-2 type transport system ATP-binding protein